MHLENLGPNVVSYEQPYSTSNIVGGAIEARFMSAIIVEFTHIGQRNLHNEVRRVRPMPSDVQEKLLKAYEAEHKEEE